MASFWRRSPLAGLIMATVLLAGGCNVLQIPYFLLFGFEDRIEPECTVFSKPKKEIKVLLVANIGPEAPFEFLRADREFCELLSRYLVRQYKESKTKVVLVPMSQVENYKDKHSNWQSDLIAMGNCFHADYIINLDLDRMTLGSGTELLQGQADVSVTVLDVHDPDENSVFKTEHHYTYPTRGPESVFDTPNRFQFRDKFFAFMVKEISKYFASYTMDQKYSMDE